MRAVNLIPVEQRRGASVGLGRSQGGAYAVLAVVCACAGLGLLYGSARHEVSSRTTQIASIDAQTQQTQADIGDLSSYEALNQSRERRVAALESLVESRFDWAHALHELGRVLPAHTSISALAGNIAGGEVATAASSSAAHAATPGAAAAPATASAVSSATPPGSVPSFTLTGCSSSQSEVALALERLRDVDGVQEVALQSSTAAAGSGSSTAGGGGCSANGSEFSLTLQFDPLPAASAYAVKATSRTVAVQPTATGVSK